MSRLLKTLPAVAIDAQSELFNCTWRSGHGAAWATLSGELDLAATPMLEEGLRTAEADDDARLIVVDLRDITFMDCGGMAIVLESAERQRRAGRRLVLVRGSREVDFVLDIAGASERVEIFDLAPEAPAVQVLLQMGTSGE
ncbi:MAG: anti-sigma factor antagonist [Thermoleophilaceae bacterium]|nr:anti-sigma factor antagonist [Thermoleophilaceae bacterium]